MLYPQSQVSARLCPVGETYNGLTPSRILATPINRSRGCKLQSGTFQPVLDWMTIICNVYDHNGNAVDAADVFRAAFGFTTQDVCFRTGEILAESGQKYVRHHNNGAGFKVWANQRRLMLSGNPTAWCQGDGSFCKFYPQFIFGFAFKQWCQLVSVPGFSIKADHFSRLDLAHMYDAGSSSRAKMYLGAFKNAVEKGRSVKTVLDDGTYWGMKSHRKSLKTYHDPHRRCPSNIVQGQMARMLRFEYVMRTDELKATFGSIDANQLKQFGHSNLQALFEQELNDLRVAAQQHVVDRMPSGLSYAQEGLILRWRNFNLEVDRRRLRYQRNRILEVAGVDIFVPPSRSAVPSEMTEYPLVEFLAKRCVTNNPEMLLEQF